MNIELGIKNTKITSFTDLEVWRVGHGIVLEVYRITKSFPKEEIFGLTSQLRRAIVSFTSNIAEGFSRYSYADKIKFYTISVGSLTEVQNQLLISRDIGYLNKEKFDDLAQKTILASKLINGLIKKSRMYAS